MERTGSSSPSPDEAGSATTQDGYDYQHAPVLASLIELASDAVIVRGPASIIVSWNRGAESLYGWTAQEAIGHVTHELLQTRFPDSREALDRFLNTGEQWEGELLHTCKDGTQVIVESRQILTRDAQNQPITILEMNRDISERKRIETREVFLTEVSKVLSSTLDYQETLANIAQLIVPQLADWFTVDLATADGLFDLIEVVHKDPEQVKWAQRLRERFPIDPAATTGAPNVIRTGRSELYPEITDEMLIASARDEEELAISRQIGYSSVMMVPLVARGKTLGVVSFVAAESGRQYNESDLALAEEVGRRAGVALDNARLYHEAQQAHDQLEIILQGVADGIMVYASDSSILYANERAAQITGYTSVQEMLTAQQHRILSRYEIVDEQGHPFPPSQLTHQRVFAGESEARAIIGAREVGSGLPERWSLVKSRPVLSESGEVVMVVTITHDITEQMLAERRKDEFISMASHELKTPVTSLKGYTNLLQRRLAKQEDEQSLQYLARMDAQFDKLTNLIDDLLDLSRMQSGKMLLRAEPCDLDALVREMVETVQAATSTHQLLIQGKTGAQVLGDPERLGQVFINLLTNAIKYSPQANTVHIQLGQKQEQGQAIVSVQDFGIGINQVHHEKIFERFYQVTDPDEKTYSGLGIGLHISHEIVTRHNGRLWVESRKGEGATFFVALPRL